MILGPGQDVQHVGRRRDRVGAQEQLQPGLRGAGHQAVGERGVAGDLPVGPGRHRGRGDLVAGGEHLGGLAVRVPGLERGDVGVADVGLAREFAGQEVEGALLGTAVQPGEQAQREHVLGARGILAAQPERGHRGHGQPGQVEGVHLVAVEGAVLQRVGGVADLGQVAIGEVGGVGQDHRPPGQVVQVRLQGGRVHHDQDVRTIAGGADVEVGEVHLEAGDAGDGSRGCPDLGREVRQGGEVVAQLSGVGGEPVAGQLHAVPGVAGETDDDPIDAANLAHAGFALPLL